MSSITNRAHDYSRQQGITVNPKIANKCVNRYVNSNAKTLSRFATEGLICLAHFRTSP